VGSCAKSLGSSELALKALAFIEPTRGTQVLELLPIRLPKPLTNPSEEACLALTSHH